MLFVVPVNPFPQKPVGAFQVSDFFFFKLTNNSFLDKTENPFDFSFALGLVRFVADMDNTNFPTGSGNLTFLFGFVKILVVAWPVGSILKECGIIGVK